MLDSNSIPQDYPGRRFLQLWGAQIRGYEKRIAKNSDDVEALVHAADLYLTLWCFGLLARDVCHPRALKASDRALTLDPSSDGAHRVRATCHLADWEFAQAEKEFQRAVDLNPASAENQHWLGLFLGAMGRLDEATPASLRAITIDPGPARYTGLGALYYFAHRFEDMASIMEKVVAMAPEFAPGFDWLGMAYIQLGRAGDSIRVYREAVRLSDGLAEMKAGLGHALGVAGCHEEARAILAEMQALAGRYYIPHVQLAYVCFGLGETDRGIAYLEEGYRHRAWELAFARQEPWFDHLHGDPRFADLLGRIGLPIG